MAHSLSENTIRTWAHWLLQTKGLVNAAGLMMLDFGSKEPQEVRRGCVGAGRSSIPGSCVECTLRLHAMHNESLAVPTPPQAGVVPGGHPQQAARPVPGLCFQQQGRLWCPGIVQQQDRPARVQHGWQVGAGGAFVKLVSSVGGGPWPPTLV